jgi:uncharacterized protein YjbI with pentapeptide repeats
VGGWLDLSGCDLKGVKLPGTVGGGLDLKGCDLKGVKLPGTVGGGLDLKGNEIGAREIMAQFETLKAKK